MLTDLQTKKLTALFNVYDIDGDSYLELKDIQAVISNLSSVRGWAADSAEYQALEQKYLVMWQNQVQMFDIDQDNRISLDEHLQFHANIFAAGQYEEFINALAGFVFDVFDSSGDGLITLAEFKGFYKAYNLAESEAEQVFPQLDLDGSGEISKDEMLQLVRDFHLSDDPKVAGNWLFGSLD
ncbi:MAG: hypothetical protein GY847_28725 [Proteobacteria bacterium]|nr:hypothetical protein [Pseudomonadota bacterium]